MKGRKLPLIDRVEVYIIEENQPRWLAFLNGEHDLVDEIPYDFANLIVPNSKLAPNLVKRGIVMDRDYRASVDMAFFNMEHPVVGGYTPDKVALRRAIGLAYSIDDEIRLVRKGIDTFAVAGVATDDGLRPCIQERDERPQSGARQGAARLVRVHRSRRRRLARDAGRPPLILEMATQPDQLSRQLDEIWRKSMTAVNHQHSFQARQVARESEELARRQVDDVASRLGGRSPDGEPFSRWATVRTRDRRTTHASICRLSTRFTRCSAPCLMGRSVRRCSSKRRNCSSPTRHTSSSAIGLRPRCFIRGSSDIGASLSCVRLWKYVDIDNDVKGERGA